jgi:hypothetical protein
MAGTQPKAPAHEHMPRHGKRTEREQPEQFERNSADVSPRAA